MATVLSVCSTEDGDEGRSLRGASIADSGVSVQDDASDVGEDSLGVSRITVRRNGATTSSAGSFGHGDVSVDSALHSLDVPSDALLGTSADLSMVTSNMDLDMDLPMGMDIPEVNVEAPDVSVDGSVVGDALISVAVSMEDVSQLSPRPREQEVEVVRAGGSGSGAHSRGRPSPTQPLLPPQLAHLGEFQFVLPSDKAWRSRNYFKLVEKQRALGATPMASAREVVVAGQGAAELRLSPTHWQPLAKRPRSPGPQLSIASSLGSAASQDAALPAWSCVDLAKTGRLLSQPPTPVDFDDEAEMRRVFALAYDVYRYKNVLQQALEDCGFFDQFAQHAGNAPRAWLLLYDLNKRRFRPREAADLHATSLALSSRQILTDAGLAEMDGDLWKMRVHLAAALARLRVRRRALRLSQLLPVHLRDGRIINHEDALVTGWINTFKSSRQQVCSGLDRLGLKLVDDGLAGRDRTLHAAREGAASVSQEDYRFDPVLPNVIVSHPEQRDELAQATVVRKCYLVLQDRAFCFGPAMMCKLLSDYDLSGCVAQTHIHSPRSTAYLAAILADNVKIETLLAFGAGPRKQQYKAYFRKLGVTNAEVFEERFLDVLGSSVLDNVVAILATPPNSYSAVTDPVDLVCSRGGDLAMLQQLTEPSGPGGAAGGAAMLQEQADTLRLAMAKPQVQFVVYETHSVYSTENQRLARRLVREMNTVARERHAEEQRRAAWLASLAAAAEQGVPGEKRAKQHAVQQEQQASKQDEKEEKKEDKKEPTKKKKKETKKKPQDELGGPSMGAGLASVALSVVLERRRSSTASVLPDGMTAPEIAEPADQSASHVHDGGDSEVREQAPTDGNSVATELTTDQSMDQQLPEGLSPSCEQQIPNATAGASTSEQTTGEILPEESSGEKPPEEQAPEQTEEKPAAEDAAPAAPVVKVPACDLFEIGLLPDLCPRGDGCLSVKNEGCFLALIKRQEIVRMDANYMIKMAEARGLFGSAPGVRRTTAAERARLKREREEAEARARGRARRSGSAGGPLDVERLSAPTRASRARQQRIPPRPRRASNMSWESDDSHEGPALALDLLEGECPRFAQHMQAIEAAPARLMEARRKEARRWWSETTRHMAALGASGWRYLVDPSSHARLRLTRSATETAPTFAVCSLHRHPFPLRVCLLEL